MIVSRTTSIQEGIESTPIASLYWFSTFSQVSRKELRDRGGNLLWKYKAASIQEGIERLQLNAILLVYPL